MLELGREDMPALPESYGVDAERKCEQVGDIHVMVDRMDCPLSAEDRAGFTTCVRPFRLSDPWADLIGMYLVNSQFWSFNAICNSFCSQYRCYILLPNHLVIIPSFPPPSPSPPSPGTCPRPRPRPHPLPTQSPPSPQQDLSYCPHPLTGPSSCPTELPFTSNGLTPTASHAPPS